MKPLAPSFTCLFHSTEYFKQLWGATNTVAHSENMFVKIKSIVVSMSKACMKMQCYPHHYLLFLSTSSLPLYFPFHRSAHNSVRTEPQSSYGSNASHLSFLYTATLSPSFFIWFLTAGCSSDTVHMGILLKCPSPHFPYFLVHNESMLNFI